MKVAVRTELYFASILWSRSALCTAFCHKVH